MSWWLRRGGFAVIKQTPALLSLPVVSRVADGLLGLRS
jgi:hypothetical protein